MESSVATGMMVDVIRDHEVTPGDNIRDSQEVVTHLMHSDPEVHEM